MSLEGSVHRKYDINHVTVTLRVARRRLCRLGWHGNRVPLMTDMHMHDGSINYAAAVM